MGDQAFYIDLEVFKWLGYKVTSENQGRYHGYLTTYC